MLISRHFPAINQISIKFVRINLLSLRIFVFIFLLVPCLLKAQELSLKGEWEYRIGQSGEWKSTTLPGRFAKLLPDFKFDDYLRIRKTVDVPLEMLDQKSVRLHLDHVDTYCRVLVNGDLIDTLKNFFIPCDLEIKEHLLPGENEIVLEFIPPRWYMASYWKSKSLEYSEKRKKLEEEMHVRRPRLLSEEPDFAVYGQMKISAYNHINIKKVNFKLLSESDGRAKVLIKVRADVYETGQYKFESDYFSNEEKILAGNDRDIIWTFFVDEFKYWYPKNIGEPNFIKDELKVSYMRLDGKEYEEDLKHPYRLGFHKVELIQNPKNEEEFSFEIEGMGLDLVASVYLHKYYGDSMSQWKQMLQFFQFAEEEKINLVNVSGRGGYPPNSFYKTCDSLGILVWQDFAFDGLGYPSDSLLYKNARKEIAFQMRRVSQFPSFGLFSGSTYIDDQFEDEALFEKYDISKKELKTFQKGQEDLFSRIFPAQIGKFNSRLYYKVHSANFNGNKKNYSFGKLKLSD